MEMSTFLGWVMVRSFSIRQVESLSFVIRVVNIECLSLSITLSILGEGHVPIFTAFTQSNVQPHTGAIDIADL